jgi:hypothetical protein
MRCAGEDEHDEGKEGGNGVNYEDRRESGSRARRKIEGSRLGCSEGFGYIHQISYGDVWRCEGGEGFASLRYQQFPQFH